MQRLEGDHYVVTTASIALPVLDAQTLTRFLRLAGEKTQHQILLAFEEWLDSLPLIGSTAKGATDRIHAICIFRRSLPAPLRSSFPEESGAFSPRGGNVY